MNGVFSMLGPEGYGSYRWEGSSFTRVHDAPRAILTPGFIDLHIHGAFGIDFMTASTEDFLVLCSKLAAEGYEGFLPTSITASAFNVQAALDRLPVHPMILGFHLEGPFISKTYPGAQPPEAILEAPAGLSEWDRILSDERLKIVTLAPEVPRGLDLVLRLQKRDIIVSMGHTNATYDEARRGFEFGATHVTHTYNAMRGLHHREPGMLGYALASDDLKCELIYDRLHVCKEAASILFKSKPETNVIAVSDSTAATGLPKGTKLNMWGHDALVGQKVVHLAGTDTLAGSAITLRDAFQNLAEDFGIESAIRSCCHNPRLALGIKSTPKVYLEWGNDWELLAIHRLDPAD